MAATGPGGRGEAVRLARLSAGHYIGFPVLAAGAWRFTVTFDTGGRSRSFTFERTLG